MCPESNLQSNSQNYVADSTRFDLVGIFAIPGALLTATPEDHLRLGVAAEIGPVFLRPRRINLRALIQRHDEGRPRDQIIHQRPRPSRIRHARFSLAGRDLYACQSPPSLATRKGRDDSCRLATPCRGATQVRRSSHETSPRQSECLPAAGFKAHRRWIHRPQSREVNPIPLDRPAEEIPGRRPTCPGLGIVRATQTWAQRRERHRPRRMPAAQSLQLNRPPYLFVKHSLMEKPYDPHPVHRPKARNRRLFRPVPTTWLQR